MWLKDALKAQRHRRNWGVTQRRLWKKISAQSTTFVQQPRIGSRSPEISRGSFSPAILAGPGGCSDFAAPLLSPAASLTAMPVAPLVRVPRFIPLMRGRRCRHHRYKTHSGNDWNVATGKTVTTRLTGFSRSHGIADRSGQSSTTRVSRAIVTAPTTASRTMCRMLSATVSVRGVVPATHGSGDWNSGMRPTGFSKGAA